MFLFQAFGNSLTQRHSFKACPQSLFCPIAYLVLLLAVEADRERGLMMTGEVCILHCHFGIFCKPLTLPIALLCIGLVLLGWCMCLVVCAKSDLLPISASGSRDLTFLLVCKHRVSKLPLFSW